MGIGDWGLGIGDWGLGPTPHPHTPIPIKKVLILFFIYKYLKFINNFLIYFIIMFFHGDWGFGGGGLGVGGLVWGA